jgi:hypothetical protein
VRSSGLRSLLGGRLFIGNSVKRLGRRKAKTAAGRSYDLYGDRVGQGTVVYIQHSEIFFQNICLPDYATRGSVLSLRPDSGQTAEK